MKADVVWTNAYVLPMTGDNGGLFADGAVAIKGNKIIAVGKTQDVLREVQAEEQIDAEGKLLMPGLIDAHIHSSYAIVRGVAQDMDNWMQKGVWPWMKYMDLKDQQAGSVMNIIEGVRAGTTTFADYDANMSSLLESYASIGVRVHAAEMINEMPKDIGDLPVGELYPLDPSIGEQKLQANIQLYEKWHGAENSRISVMFGPQGPDMMSLDLLKQVEREAVRYDTNLHMHVCQGDREILQLEKRYGKRSIPFLEENNLLNSRLIAVHLTEATEEETKQAAKSGAKMINCAGSIAIIDGIVPPVEVFTQAGGTAALGSDQAPGNNGNNMFNEMKFAAILNKVKARDPKVFPALKALKMATIEAAKVHGLDHHIGSLEAGKKADMLVIDTREPTLSPVLLYPVENVIANLVYAARGEEVKDVIVDGRFIMKDRVMQHIDQAKAMQALQYRAEKLAEKVKA
ncbi:amidohydrolase family protein [Alkalicoccus daliensis]|uniref:5-methylthioadenosine/S-adenosylhomocysteine deaminase n=1 Tax=Alkalicoccus daliensis TaxID=745820 RepID=A0A1H0I1C2_9BACI|nr:amidohydrolase family protein [Alkalicoccus daliensis]SDO24881.1 5-methylthioadenosine/S-adenosylhomocysteine deaminase [Alkalicoccus daliensis]